MSLKLTVLLKEIGEDCGLKILNYNMFFVFLYKVRFINFF